jgi:hypothetical protein
MFKPRHRHRHPRLRRALVALLITRDRKRRGKR